MTYTNKIFFELIQVAIGKRVCLLHTPSAAEWQTLYDMALKQSLVGICFAGVQKLQEQQQAPPEMLYLQWMGMAAKIQQRNEVLNKRQPEVLRYFRENGFPCVVLKGQGVADLYKVSEPSAVSEFQRVSSDLTKLRQSGDIDVWLDCKREELYEFSKKEFGKVEGITYHHIHYPKWDGVEVEAHIYPSFLSSPRRHKALKEFCEIHKPKGNDNDGFDRLTNRDDNLNDNVNPNHNDTSLILKHDVPSLAFNRVYILLHCYRHFCGHGIGLRQLLDYYFVLKASLHLSPEVKRDSNDWIKRLGMERFAMATSWVLGYVFEGNPDSPSFRKGLGEGFFDPDAEYGKFLLEEVMRSGNFGQGDEKNRISGSALKRYLYNIKRDIRTMRICPHEALWDPAFNVYQFLMIKFVWNK